MNRSDEWHERRKHFIGASEVATIMNANPYGNQYELWATKKGMIPPFGGNDATQLGQDLEGSILDIAERDFGHIDRDVEYQHDSLPLRATLDGETVNGDGISCPIECKTAGMLSGRANGWGDEGLVQYADQVPQHYYVQVQAQLLVSEMELAYLYALMPQRGVVKYKIIADRDLHSMIEQKVDDWWQCHMIDDVAPSMLGVSSKVLSMLPRQEIQIELDDRVSRVIDELEHAKSERKRIDEKVKMLQTVIVSELGEADAGSLSDGTLVTYKETKRKAHTREVPESAFRTLRVKKVKA